MMYNPKAKFVSELGGALRICDPETGVIRLAVAIPPGVVSMSAYADFVGLGEWSVSEEVGILKPRSGYVVQQAPGRKDTGANPDWQPSVHTQMQRQMESIVKKMLPRAIKDQARQRQIEKLAALGMPTRKAEPEPELVDKDDKAEPAPEASTGDDAKQ